MTAVYQLIIVLCIQASNVPCDYVVTHFQSVKETDCQETAAHFNEHLGLHTTLGNPNAPLAGEAYCIQRQPT